MTLGIASSANVEPEGPSADWLTRLVCDIPSAIALFDRDLRYIAANSAWLNAFGFTGDAIAGRLHSEVDAYGGATLGELQRRALDGTTLEACEDAQQGSGDGIHQRVISVRPRRATDGTIVGVVAVLQDVPPAAAEKTLQETCDGLTGLAGRHRFMAAIRAALIATGAARRPRAMYLLDIDNFKGVNDLYGARVGDSVLRTIANRLMAGMRSRPVSLGRGRSVQSDLIARLGADEFGIILGTPGPNQGDVEAVANRILALIGEPFIIGEHRIRLTANIGFVMTGNAHASEDEVMRDLDVALQEAKARGPNNAKAWEPALTSTVGRRLALLDQLRKALDEGEFVMHYQPILQLGDGRAVGAEALLRWNHPSDGLVAPAAFLPVLEDTGLIVPVGRWVIREVVRQMRIWQMLYGRDIVDWVSVNVSARQFNDPSMLLATLGEINDAGFALERLKVEITESAVMRNPEVTRSVLSELQTLGIRVAIDDFGTGYSALGALRHYAVDTIKIDRGFTSRLDTQDGHELVMALLRIARVYGADVIAEGIETAAQHDILQEAGCGYGQGYLFAKPMDGSSFGAYALTHLVNGQASGTR